MADWQWSNLQISRTMPFKIREEKMAESESSSISPDSTTRERLGFVPGDDVLLQLHDGKFYMGTVTKVDAAREKCLVKFDDGTDAWSSVKNLTKLNSDSSVVCVVCKKSQPSEIVPCDKCGRSYHRFCHDPYIDKEYTLPNASWLCKKCKALEPVPQFKAVSETRIAEIKPIYESKVDQNKSSLEPKVQKETKKSMVKESIRKVCSGRDQPLPLPDDKAKLPYDPDRLNWDQHHRVNDEQIYCYCGLNGEWYTQMLQCARCKQWFHEKCIGCLSYPLYSGDRFYVFVCSMCNYGKEFVRRLELKWVDLVHLMLYNLTVYNAKKYYDFDTVIIPYANDNWQTLQLPGRIRDVSEKIRKESILAVLSNNKTRFKCGREIKKRTTIWGLRARLPPPCPIVNLPPTGVIDDNVLRQCCCSDKRLQFLTPTDGCVSNIRPLSLPESTKQLHMLNQRLAESLEVSVNPSDVMRGTIYQQPEVDQSSNPSPTNQISQSLKDSSNSQPTTDTQQNKIPTQNSVTVQEKPITPPDTISLHERYSGGGFVKKSVPFPKLSLQRRRRLQSRERMLRKHKKRDKSTGEILMSDKRKGIREARYRKARKLLKNAIKNGKCPTRHAENPELPPTPPTSVSGPPTPPATSSGMSELSVPDNSNSLDLMNPLATPSTPADTSGDDEASSRCTLDSFIPPPKDFEGKNHPFRNLNELLGITPSSSASSSSASTSSQPCDSNCSSNNNCNSNSNSFASITLPLSLSSIITEPPQPIMRPTKRQLSEKDIIIDRNGQVKRRRQHRRGRPPQSQSSAYQQTASKTATFQPARNSEFARTLRSSLNTSSSMDYALNGRKLRQRNPSSDKLQPSPTLAETCNAGALPTGTTSMPPPALQQQQQQQLNTSGCSNCSLSNSPNKSCSPAKQNGADVPCKDLKSSVNTYFSAANRVASGEKFAIKAMRTLPNGKVECILDWNPN